LDGEQRGDGDDQHEHHEDAVAGDDADTPITRRLGRRDSPGVVVTVTGVEGPLVRTSRRRRLGVHGLGGRRGPRRCGRVRIEDTRLMWAVEMPALVAPTELPPARSLSQGRV
jgi:hypothetical protein